MYLEEADKFIFTVINEDALRSSEASHAGVGISVTSMVAFSGTGIELACSPFETLSFSNCIV